jgi:phosphatidylserine/phosphatidylglycerophosphate/cardiolipin synthase-like enzyme
MANTGVTGRVVKAGTTTGIAGLTVKAYDIDPLSSDDLLGQPVKTDSTGRFTIHYSTSDYRIWFPGENPDIEVRVYGAGERLLWETPKQDGVTAAMLDVGVIEIHGSNERVIDPTNPSAELQDPYWLVTHTSLDPANGIPIRLTQGNKLEWLVDGENMFPQLTEDVRGGLATTLPGELASHSPPVTSIKLINMAFNPKLISRFVFPALSDAETVKTTDHVTVYRLAEVLKAQSRLRNVPVHVLVWELERGIGGLLDSAFNLADNAEELRQFFLPSQVRVGTFKGTQLLHTKAIVVNGTRAYVVGSTMKQGYFGDQNHLIRDGRHGVEDPREEDRSGNRGLLHDVSLRVEGPCVRFIDQTISTIWAFRNSDPPAPAPQMTPFTGPDVVAAQVLRTLPGNIFTTVHANAELLPFGETGVLEAYQRAIMKAKQYVYIEDQYFNSREVVDALLARLDENKKLEVIIVLNPRPDIGGYHAHQTSLINELLTAGGARVGVFTMWGSDPSAPKVEVVPVYAHSKVCIVDDLWVAVGTANVDGASLNQRQWRVILPGLLEKILDLGKVKATTIILLFPLILALSLALMLLLLPILGPFVADAYRREFPRDTQHANPNRERQPPRHPEMNLILFDGIAGQPACGKAKELRDILWTEHLGAAPPATPPAVGGWVGHWKAAAAGYALKISTTPSPMSISHFPEKVLEWKPQRDMKAYLRALGVPLQSIELRGSGASMPFVVVETLP